MKGGVKGKPQTYSDFGEGGASVSEADSVEDKDIHIERNSALLSRSAFRLFPQKINMHYNLTGMRHAPTML